MISEMLIPHFQTPKIPTCRKFGNTGYWPGPRLGRCANAAYTQDRGFRAWRNRAENIDYFLAHPISG